MRIKDTLNLGKTKFKMRGNLPVREAEWQKEWEDNKLYEQRLKLNEGKPRFDLHDGPPFANGNIHMGHALNKISKDIIVRYINNKEQSGQDSFTQNDGSHSSSTIASDNLGGEGTTEAETGKTQADSTTQNENRGGYNL